MFKKTILTIILVSLVLTSCNNNESNTLNTEEISQIPVGIQQLKSLNISIKEFGQYHNDVLGEFMKQNPKYIITNFEKLVKDLKVTGQKLHGSKYQNLYLIDNEYPLDYNKFTLKAKSEKSFSEMIKGIYIGAVSLKVQNAFDYIVENELTYTGTHNYIEEYISTNNDLSFSDIETLEAFDIFASYSDEYWANYPTNKSGNYSLAKGCNARTQQYIGDAFGLIFSPWGALGMSAAIHILQDGGSHCL